MRSERRPTGKEHEVVIRGGINDILRDKSGDPVSQIIDPPDVKLTGLERIALNSWNKARARLGEPPAKRIEDVPRSWWTSENAPGRTAPNETVQLERRNDILQNLSSYLEGFVKGGLTIFTKNSWTARHHREE